jgi:filamentous hemagglutinin family protein
VIDQGDSSDDTTTEDDTTDDETTQEDTTEEEITPIDPTVVSENRDTQVNITSTNVQIVDIATPNSNGLSHNRYSQFDVTQEGVILNNSSTIPTTQLAGRIKANPNLSSGNEASIILNEITSATRSSLNGYLEVAGVKANVIIANPYGITANGLGFINTDRVSLTTGIANIINNSLDTFDISGGDILVEGYGLNATTQSNLELISRYISIDAPIHADSTNIISGTNLYDYYLDSAVAQTPQTSATSTAISLSTQGGIYANEINMFASEDEADINLSGEMVATTSGVNIDSNSSVILNGNIEANSIDISSNDITVANSNLNSTTTIDIATSSDILLQNSSIIANDTISLLSQTNLTNSAHIYSTNGPVSIETSSLVNSGFIYSGSDLSITTDTITNNIIGTLYANYDLAISASGISTNYGTLYANNLLSLSFDNTTLTNETTGYITSSNDLEISADIFTNKNSIYATNNIDITTQTKFENLASGVTYAEEITYAPMSEADFDALNDVGQSTYYAVGKSINTGLTYSNMYLNNLLLDNGDSNWAIYQYYYSTSRTQIAEGGIDLINWPIYEDRRVYKIAVGQSKYVRRYAITDNMKQSKIVAGNNINININGSDNINYASIISANSVNINGTGTLLDDQLQDTITKYNSVFDMYQYVKRYYEYVNVIDIYTYTNIYDYDTFDSRNSYVYRTQSVAGNSFASNANWTYVGSDNNCNSNSGTNCTQDYNSAVSYAQANPYLASTTLDSSTGIDSGIYANTLNINNSSTITKKDDKKILYTNAPIIPSSSPVSIIPQDSTIGYTQYTGESDLDIEESLTPNSSTVGPTIPAEEIIEDETPIYETPADDIVEDDTTIDDIADNDTQTEETPTDDTVVDNTPTIDKISDESKDTVVQEVTNIINSLSVLLSTNLPTVIPTQDTTISDTNNIVENNTMTNDTTKEVVQDDTATDDATEEMAQEDTATDETTEEIAQEDTVTDETTEEIAQEDTVTDETTEEIAKDNSVKESVTKEIAKATTKSISATKEIAKVDTKKTTNKVAKNTKTTKSTAKKERLKDRVALKKSTKKSKTNKKSKSSIKLKNRTLLAMNRLALKHTRSSGSVSLGMSKNNLSRLTQRRSNTTATNVKLSTKIFMNRLKANYTKSSGSVTLSTTKGNLIATKKSVKSSGSVSISSSKPSKLNGKKSVKSSGSVSISSSKPSKLNSKKSIINSGSVSISSSKPSKLNNKKSIISSGSVQLGSTKIDKKIMKKKKEKVEPIKLY